MRIYIILMVLFAIGYAPVYWASGPVLRRHIGAPFVASYVVLIFTAAFLPPIIFYIAIVSFMVATTFSRVDVMCRFVLLAALLPSVGAHATLGSLYLIDFSSMHLLALGAWLACLFKRDRTRVAAPRGLTIEDAAILILWLVLDFAPTRLTNGATSLARELVSGAIQLLLPYYLVRRYVRNGREFRTILACVAVAAALLSVYALYESRNGWSLFGDINGRLGAAKVGQRNLMVRGDALRASVTMSGALMLGAVLCFGWTALACSRSYFRTRNLWLAGLGLVFLGELAAQSRGNLACLALSVLILLAAQRRTGLAAGAAAGMSVLGAGLLLFGRSSSKVSGFLRLGESTGDDAYDYRQTLLRRGMEEASKHRWTGADLQFVMTQLDDIRQGQGIIDFVNTYLYIYLVAGVIGVIPLIFSFLGAAVRMVGSLRGLRDPDLEPWRAFLIAATVAVLLELFFMSFVDRMPILITMLLAGGRLLSFERKRIRQAQRTTGAAEPRTPPTRIAHAG